MKPESNASVDGGNVYAPANRSQFVRPLVFGTVAVLMAAGIAGIALKSRSFTKLGPDPLAFEFQRESSTTPRIAWSVGLAVAPVAESVENIELRPLFVHSRAAPRPSQALGLRSFAGLTPPPVSLDRNHDAALSPDSVRNVMHQNRGQWELCYAQGLRADPTLAGRVDLRFTVKPDGRVDNVETMGSSDRVNDSSTLACIESSVRKLQFAPPSSGPVDVAYPMTLVPNII